LREFLQILCFRRGLNKNSAGVFIARIQGMLKTAQKAKPDLVNWLRPTLKVNRKLEFERRLVEDSEYVALVNILLDPPLAPSRRNERNALWREAGDAVQLLRMTGARFNELLRMRLDQFQWSKGKVRLNGSKTENERDIPLWDCIGDVVQRRIREELIDEEYLFPRARTKTFDNAIARACRKAAKLAKINYGRVNGFTYHSFRHTFVTDLMEATGNDVALVMSYSDHRSLESFRAYLHPSRESSILAKQRMNSVGELLGTFKRNHGKEGTAGTEVSSDKPLKIKEAGS
jgi:integrase